MKIISVNQYKDEHGNINTKKKIKNLTLVVKYGPGTCTAWPIDIFS